MLIACSKAKETKSSLGLTSIAFGLKQGDISNANLVVNTSSKTVSFSVDCSEAMTELLISFDDGASFTRATSIQCSDGKSALEINLRDLLGNVPELDILNSVIPYQMKASGPDFESLSIAGYFLFPQFTGEYITLAGGATTTNSLQVEADFAAAIFAGDFLLEPKGIYISTTPNCGEGGNWYDFASGKKSNIDLPQAHGTNVIYAKFRDTAGNESICVSDSISHAP